MFRKKDPKASEAACLRVGKRARTYITCGDSPLLGIYVMELDGFEKT
jgi:hypothetical protein